MKSAFPPCKKSYLVQGKQSPGHSIIVNKVHQKNQMKKELSR